jgi:broad specificity phosphatase PhoE
VSAPPTTRDDAPAYLARYLAKRRAREAATAEPVAYTEKGKPPYIERARAAAAARADAQKARDEAPPGGVSEAYAQETVSPRELVPPPFMKERLQSGVDVRLIRHGQTQGYATNAGLSALGRWQAHRKGQNLARGVKPGMRIRFPHAPTARAGETAVALREGLLQGMARYGLGEGVEVEEPHVNRWFNNFQVWCEGKEQDVTDAFMEYATKLEDYERHKGGDRPGWMTEMKRFWEIQQAGGDPITHWIRMPMMYFEPPASCVRRFWYGIRKEVEDATGPTRVLVATHSGPIRAVATSAFGHDPGEPTNTEDVRCRVYADREHAVVTYRGRALDIAMPTHFLPSWHVPPEQRKEAAP